MSRLKELRITSLRNIVSASLACHPRFNLIHGRNGSGKTSILEAVSLVAQGKSFRTSHTESLINSSSADATVFAELEDGHRIGINRTRTGYTLNLDGQSQKNWDSVLKKAPILVLDSGAFALLEGGPKSRRQFLDWGTFHVEPQFISLWRRAKKSLAHRNHLLKSANPDWSHIQVWDRELVQVSDEIDLARTRYIDALQPVFGRVYGALAPEAPYELSVTYEPGWDTTAGLASVLEANRSKDLKYRFTQYGPQRADVIIRADSRDAVEVLSRGQQKILVSALKIAQGMVQSESGELGCVYLIDDLPAELDSENRAVVISFLSKLQSQLFVTCVDAGELIESLTEPPEMELFHVERGVVSH